MTRSGVHLLVLLTVALSALIGLSGALQTALTDLRFRWTPRAASGDIVLIAIDPRSIDQVGVWPWPRSLHARLIEKLDAAGVTDIVFDVDFSSPSNPAADKAFADALKAANGSVVLPVFQQAEAARSANIHSNRPLPAFASQSWTAAVNVAIEPDGRVRHYPLGSRIGGELVPSMAAVLAGESRVSAGDFIIDFGVAARTVPTLSYVDVLNGDATALKSLAGKKVLIGGAALELGDRFSVPNGAVLPGPLLQIVAAESIAQKRMLSTTSVAPTIAGVIAIALLMLAMWRRTSVSVRVGTLLSLAAGIEAVALLVQREAPVIVGTSSLQIAIAGYLAAAALDEIDIRGLLARIAERRFQRIAMSLGDGVVCADPSGNITAWNPAAEAIFGYAAGETIGRPFDLIVANADPASETTFSLRNAPADQLQAVGGYVVEFDGRRKDGAIIVVEACFSAWHGTDGLSYGASLRDITARKREAERMRYLAEFDSITDLPNGNALQSRVEETLSGACRAGKSAALILVSIDNLPRTNMMFGQAFGEGVLRAAGERLQEFVGNPGLVAKLGGDEFGVLVVDADRGTAGELGHRCAHAFGAPLLIDGREHGVTVHIGIAVLPEDGTSADEALGNAHIALYQSQHQSTGRPTFYVAADRHRIESRMSIEAELVRAAARHEFELFYQPQLSLADRRVIGAEALIRWRHPTRGLVPPAEFMPVANSSAVSEHVASWVLLSACRQASAWAAAGHPIRIGVNLSPSQFATGDLCDQVAGVLAATGLQPSLLELEVTEDILLDDAARVLSIVRGLQELGVRLVFDDFGTGFGSLSYLKTFPLDGLKIDRSFVQDLVRNRGDAAIVRSTISLARDLNLSVIAEGIEDATTADMLTGMGCQEGQGYHFGKPCPAVEFGRAFLGVNTEELVA